jgi:hypothetical protein
MDFGTGTVILGEFALLGAVVWGAMHEKALLAFEKAAAKKIRARLDRQARKRARARMEKLNRKALYTPVKAPRQNAGEKAA